MQHLHLLLFKVESWRIVSWPGDNVVKLFSSSLMMQGNKLECLSLANFRLVECFRGKRIECTFRKALAVPQKLDYAKKLVKDQHSSLFCRSVSGLTLAVNLMKPFSVTDKDSE